MSRGPWRVQPKEIARTIKSVRSIGLPVDSVEIANGAIKLNLASGDHVGVPVKPKADVTALEQWRRERGQGQA